MGEVYMSSRKNLMLNNFYRITPPSRMRSGSSYIPCISVSPVDANIQIFELQI